MKNDYKTGRQVESYSKRDGQGGSRTEVLKELLLFTKLRQTQSTHNTVLPCGRPAILNINHKKRKGCLTKNPTIPLQSL